MSSKEDKAIDSLTNQLIDIIKQRIEAADTSVDDPIYEACMFVAEQEAELMVEMDECLGNGQGDNGVGDETLTHTGVLQLLIVAGKRLPGPYQTRAHIRKWVANQVRIWGDVKAATRIINQHIDEYMGWYVEEGKEKRSGKR